MPKPITLNADGSVSVRINEHGITAERALEFAAELMEVARAGVRREREKLERDAAKFERNVPGALRPNGDL